LIAVDHHRLAEIQRRIIRTIGTPVSTSARASSSLVNPASSRPNTSAVGHPLRLLLQQRQQLLRRGVIVKTRAAGGGGDGKIDVVQRLGKGG
jgi:hypothetical protein